ncbi:MAG: DUF4870 domain-containing protein [Calditrichia bacterium]|nr:DUF4870 domain-containing protein [Calditrichia bacterium]
MTDQNDQSGEVNVSKKDENMWGMLCHLSALAGVVIPFGNIIAPLIIWILKKEEFPFVDDQGKESLNFQISITIYFVIGIILVFVAIGIVILPLIGLFALIMIIVASIKANDGVKYRYPLTIRIIN